MDVFRLESGLWAFGNVVSGAEAAISVAMLHGETHHYKETWVLWLPLKVSLLIDIGDVCNASFTCNTNVFLRDSSNQRCPSHQPILVVYLKWKLQEVWTISILSQMQYLGPVFYYLGAKYMFWRCWGNFHDGNVSSSPTFMHLEPEIHLWSPGSAFRDRLLVQWSTAGVVICPAIALRTDVLYSRWSRNVQNGGSDSSWC